MFDICQICREKIPEPSHFWKTHKIKEKTYFETYFPQFNLLTGKKIQFKSRNSYFFNDFDDKNELRNYLSTLSSVDLTEYCKYWLQKRLVLKEELFVPSQVELRTLVAPTLVTFLKVLPDFYDYCEEIGYKPRFKLNKTIKKTNSLPPGFKIFCDTREQKMAKLQLPFEIKKLDTGDYTSNLNPNVFIERKSLPDLISSLSGGYERICREIERGQENGSYLIFLVESSLSDFLSFNHLPWISKKIKASPEFISHRIRELIQKYNNIQFLFVNGRTEITRCIQLLLTVDILTHETDLQYLYDIKAL